MNKRKFLTRFYNKILQFIVDNDKNQNLISEQKKFLKNGILIFNNVIPSSQNLFLPFLLYRIEFNAFVLPYL